MDKQQYDTIKLQINQEKEHILKRVYELTAEKEKIEQKKEYDLYVVKSRSKVVQTGQRIMAGMLSSHTFSPERIEENGIEKLKKQKVLFKKMKAF